MYGGKDSIVSKIAAAVIILGLLLDLIVWLLGKCGIKIM